MARQAEECAGDAGRRGQPKPGPGKRLLRVRKLRGSLVLRRRVARRGSPLSLVTR